MKTIRPVLYFMPGLLLVLLMGPRLSAHASSGTWSATGSMSTAHTEHTATLLKNGKVLVAGGISTSTGLSSAELYDPSSGTWSVTGSMSAVRAGHTATLLPDGNVLVAGGGDTGGILSSAELFTQSAAAQVSGLTSTIDSLNLPKGTQDSFDGQLQAVQAALATNNTVQACSDLTAFINHVKSQSGKKLTTSQATQLLGAAQQIQAVLAC